MPKSLAAEDFEPFIGTQFHVAGWPDVLALVAVDRHKALPDLQRAPFTILFRGPRSRLLPEGLYHVAAEGEAGFELYIIPILTLASDVQDYQCVFN